MRNIPPRVICECRCIEECKDYDTFLSKKGIIDCEEMVKEYARMTDQRSMLISELGEKYNEIINTINEYSNAIAESIDREIINEIIINHSPNNNIKVDIEG